MRGKTSSKRKDKDLHEWEVEIDALKIKKGAFMKRIYQKVTKKGSIVWWVATLLFVSTANQKAYCANLDVANSLSDREKIQGTLNQAITSLDVDQINATVDRSVDQTLDVLQQKIYTLENEINSLESDIHAIQDKIRDYHWEKWLPSHASYGSATLSDLKLGETHAPVILTAPGQQIEGEVVCSLNREQCSPLKMYRVVLGIKNRGGQITVFNHFGLHAGKEVEHFTIEAPNERGIYQVGFKVVETIWTDTALKSWEEDTENDGGTPAIIGLIVVT